MSQPTRLALLARLGPGRPVRLHIPPPETPLMRRRRPWRRVVGLLAVLALGTGSFLAAGIVLLLTNSLPPVNGTRTVGGLSAPVTIERDERGIPTLRADNTDDLAFATGFVHGQDRFFQMDLLRRHAAGELAELLGVGVLPEDRRMRLHRFRWRAVRALADLPEIERALLRSYARGVEAGRLSLRGPNFEYLVLGVPPAPWREEETLLVALGMYHVLQQGPIEHERTNAVLDVLPPALAEFLSPAGSSWDVPLTGGPLPSPVIPHADAIDLRRSPDDWTPPPTPTSGAERFAAGSNNWAISGKRSGHGGAIVANDMHMGLFVPNIWYRAAFVWKDPDGVEYRVIGATLPGTPVMVVGSNTHVAWGFTNSEGDYADLVLLKPIPGRPDHYQTPDGPRAIENVVESIRVKGGPEVRLRIEQTIWGPILDRDHRGRRRALRWVAHDRGAVNLEMRRLHTARSVKEVLDIASRSGTPAENIVAADERGNIAWTILGRIPRRIGFDGRRPTSWADGKCRWDGWLPAADYPRIVEPPDGRLWTANNRVIGEPSLSRLGLGTYDLGARAMQIRDGLNVARKLVERDMLAIQLDDRALFLARWQNLLVTVLSRSHQAGNANRQAMYHEVVGWGARAEPGSVGFRLVKRFRAGVRDMVLRSLTAPCLRADPRFQFSWLDANVEESVWQLVTHRPIHLLPPNFASWEELLLAAIDTVEREVKGKRSDFLPALQAYTQGGATRTQIHHPFRSTLGPVGRWLRIDMPDEELPGDSQAMPRIQAPRFGATQRMAVSPGKEEEGYFHMPGGQSGNPLSPHYRDSHGDWAKGRPTPFLPGPAKHVLVLRPE